MLGRDKLREKGAKLASSSNWSDSDDVQLGQATRCVKKFAPSGQQRMGRTDSGHITACKISDANPNELIVSWSGDWIYSFDILRSPDATEELTASNVTAGSSRSRGKDKGRKRKRPKSTALVEEAAERASSRQCTESAQASPADPHDSLALRVNYGNGQSEEIRIQPPDSPISENETAALKDTDHYRLAKTTIKIQEQILRSSSDPPHTSNFTSVLGFAASLVPEMDDISRTWGYPIDPNQVDVAVQNKLRDSRAASRRFVQAAGTLARVLGGQLRTGGNSDAIISRYFATIQPSPNERPLPRHEQFGYDFLKAILLWLDSGLGALVEGFTSSSGNSRLPIPPDADVDAIDDILIPYLLSLAGDGSIVDVDVSRFEKDDRRIVHASEKGAVLAFARVLKIPFADLTGAVVPTSGSSTEHHSVQDRKTAVQRWAFKVGRGILLNAAKDIRFSFVDRAFGGTGRSDASTRAEEQALREQQEDIDPTEEDDAIVEAELVSRAWAEQSTESPSAQEVIGPMILVEEGEPSQQYVWNGSIPVPMPTVESATEESDDEEDDSDGDIDPEEDEDEDDDDGEGLSRTRSGRILWRSDFDRSYLRERVEAHVPCTQHTKVYKGHCNVRTVKDVNYFGLQDEYVVSGSDSGHVFIWDRKTSQLLNILEGDGEVVNVVQGHPYEPTMAVSGIDHTIKIFSPDAQMQRNARKGIGVQSADPGLSSLGFGMRRRLRTSRSPDSMTAEVGLGSRELVNDSDEDDELVEGNGLSSRKRMHREYEITSQNDLDRKGGREDAFITVSDWPFFGLPLLPY
jgi:nuclear receptor interaction protein